MILDFCCICGKTSDLHNHHIIPRAKGGTEHETNMITLCTKHHTWIHGLKPNTWNNHKNLVIEGQNRAKEQGKHTNMYKMPGHIIQYETPIGNAWVLCEEVKK